MVAYRWLTDLAGTFAPSFGIGPRDLRATLDAGGLTADRVHALPDASGTLVVAAPLTEGRVVYTGPGGTLADNEGFTFDPATRRVGLVDGEIDFQTQNGGRLRLTNTGLRYDPDGVGHTFQINRSGHDIRSQTWGNTVAWRFNRFATTMTVGITTGGTDRGFISMTGDQPVHVNIDGVTVARFLKGQISVDRVTASTSTTTGAFVVAGGVGIGGNLHVGGDLVLNPALDGALRVVNGVVSLVGVIPGVPYSQLVNAFGSTETNLVLDGVRLHALLSTTAPDTPWSFDSPLLSIKGLFDTGFWSGTPGVEVGVALPTGDDQFSLFVRNADNGDEIIRVDYQSGVYDTTLSGYLRISDSVEVAATGWAYLGAPNAEGSWRIGRNGGDMVFQRREGGAWVTKTTIDA